MVKNVDVCEVLLKEYKDKELVHYIATRLRYMLNYDAESNDLTLMNLGAMVENIMFLYRLADALDKRMNKDTSDPKIML